MTAVLKFFTKTNVEPLIHKLEELLADHVFFLYGEVEAYILSRERKSLEDKAFQNAQTLLDGHQALAAQLTCSILGHDFAASLGQLDDAPQCFETTSPLTDMMLSDVEAFWRKHQGEFIELTPDRITRVRDFVVDYLSGLITKAFEDPDQFVNRPVTTDSVVTEAERFMFRVQLESILYGYHPPRARSDMALFPL